jgi:hypothetical protein
MSYCGASPLPDGSLVFSLDVCLALDSFSRFRMRVRVATLEAPGTSPRYEPRLTSATDALPATDMDRERG